MTSVQTELIKLVPSDVASDDYFGNAIAISGNYAIMGSYYDDDNGSDSGSAYIFELSNGTWTQKQKLLASDATSNDKFGCDVGISGNYAIVGADGDVSNRGSAYIFELSNGTWSQKQKLLASDAASGDYFGAYVAISGNYAIVGAWRNDDNGSDSGSAYIFELSNGTWSQKHKLLASDAAERDKFGRSVAISGNYAIVGAISGDYDNGYDSGSAYIFELSNGTWSQKQKLLASDAAYNDRFGESVAISGNYAIVGAYGNDDNGNDSGAAYIYELSNGTWSQKQKLLASDAATGDKFGDAVAISGNYAIVGAITGKDNNGNSSGSAYIFELSNGTWTQKQKLLASDAASYDYFSFSVAISSNYAIVGAHYGKDNNGNSSGSAYIFEVSGGGNGGSVPAEEQSLTDLNIDTADIDTLKAVSFSNKSNGKGNPDATARAKMKSLITGESNATNKRKKRRAVLKLLFSKDTDVTKMIIPKEDLQLPNGFTKTNALVVKAGESLNITDLSSDEGFYSVLDDGETIAITTDNTTLTFARQDVGGNELYTVSATTCTDIVINSDNVSTGSFTDENNTGTLAPDDSVTIDGRVFIIGSVADGGAGGSGGDPYVFPLKSNIPVKLPNKPAVYRMFEQGNNYVNVEVDRATNNHKLRMFNYARKITPVTHNIVLDGYFYQKAFISAEGHKLTIDYTTKKANCNEESAKFFDMKQSEKLFDCGDFKEKASCWTVGWTTKENKKIQVQLMFFPNPHIENGINVIPSTLKNSTGLIVDNYKPKFMELPSLTTEKFGKLHRKLNKAKNIHQKMSIKGKNEKWHFN